MFLSKIIELYSGTDTIVALAIITTCYITARLLQHYFTTEQSKVPPTDLPILNLIDNDFARAKDQYLNGLSGLLQEGYRRYKHGFYQLWGVDGYITIASADFLEEINNLPEGTLDFHTATQKRMIGNYTWLRVADQLLAHTIATDLTRQIGNLLPRLCEEIEHIIQHEFPDCKDWTPIAVHQISPKLIATTMGRVFVGAGLNRNEEWVQTAIQFVDDVFAGGWKLKGYSLFMRPFAARFLIPEIRRVWKHQATARRFLVPIMQSRSLAVDSSEREQGSSYENPNDLIQWLLDNAGKDLPVQSFENLANLALVAYLGSTHTTATTLSQLLLDLAARPEYIEPLREELVAVHYEVQGVSGLGSTRQNFDINRTSKLDSFMKESQRLNPAFLMSYSRIIAKPLQLSNGVIFSAGTHILVPASQISLDPEIYESPELFKGFRFADLRAAESGSSHRYQFTTTSPRAMHFGYGRQACPGRFFASVVIKATMAYLLTEFDIRLAEEGDRPASGVVGAQVSPSKNAQILFRRRKARKEGEFGQQSR